MKALTYTAVLERNEIGGYTVTVPALKGCVTQGETIASALSRAREAIESHTEALAMLGKRLPPDCKFVRLETEELSEVMVFKVTAQLDLESARAGVKVA